nr:hypothetical protein [Acidobacteriota bacterium]
MAQIAIAAAVSVGIGFAEHFLAPKPKLPKVDRGRNDDVRLMTSEEGTFLPICKGWARLAPNIIWMTDVKEIAQKSTVGGGGKGLGGHNQTQEETTFTYSRSLCCAIAGMRAMNGLRRIWANGEVIF